MASSQKRITKELSELTQSPPAGISVSLVDESDLFAWKATLEGPEGSPYAGGKFNVLLTLPSSYPFKPPTLSFLTKIYHPNISNDVPAPSSSTGSSRPSQSSSTASTISPTSFRSAAAAASAAAEAAMISPAPTPLSTTAPATTGLMCLGPLRPDAWKPSTKISAILEFARQLLREPNPDDAVETRIADEYKNDRKAFEKEAKEWTKRYASGKK